MNSNNIGKYLLKKRKERSLTQAELAKKLDVTFQAVSRWENGDSIPDIGTLVQLADLYSISVDDILQRQANTLITEKSNPLEDKLMHIVLTIFIIGNILGFGLFILFGYLGIDRANEIYSIIAIISLVMFLLSSHFVFNVYFYILSKKEVEDVKLYMLGYTIFSIMLILLSTFLISGIYPYITIVVVSLFLILLKYFITNKYIESMFLLDFIYKNIPKYKKILIVLLIIVPVLNPLFFMEYYFTMLLEVILFSIIALK